MTTVTVERPSDSAGMVRVSTGGGGGGGHGDISLAPAAKPPPAPPQPTITPRPLPPPRQPPPPRPLPPAREVQSALAGLANPNKLRPPQDDEDDEDDEGGYDEDSEGGGGDDGDGGDTGDDDDDLDDLPDDENEEFEDELKPAEGFRTLDDEKADIVFKLGRYRKRGMQGLRAFTVHSDIRELRAELKRVKTELDLDSSIKFQRKVMMAVVSGIEFMNRKYSPFELQLDGWPETVHSDLNSYDEVFEQLFFKYRGKVSAPPEIKLLMMVGGSAMMFHYTNTMMKAMPQMTPEAMQGMQAMLANMAQQQQSQPQPQQQSQPQPQQYPQQYPQQPQQPSAPSEQPQRHQMRGPGVDLGALLGGLPPTLPLSAGPPPPQPSRAPRQLPPPPAPESDRFSDIVSEDLESVPDDLQSIASVTSSQPRGVKRGNGQVKHVVLDGGGRKRRTTTKNTRNVVVI